MRTSPVSLTTRLARAVAIALAGGGMLYASGCASTAISLVSYGLESYAASQRDDEPTIGDFVDQGFSRLLEELDP